MATMTTSLQLLDTVALTLDLPTHNLVAGQVGTIVEQLAPDRFEVEFNDDAGQTYAQVALPPHQLLRLIYTPTFPPTMNHIFQNHSGSGDNVAGDKTEATYTTNLPNANIANFANEVKDSAQQVASQFTQTSGASPAELLALIGKLRQAASQFPTEVQEDLIIDLDDVEAEIQKPENQRNAAKLRKRLLALAMVIGTVATPIAATTDFANSLIDLGTKVGIELPQLPYDIR